MKTLRWKLIFVVCIAGTIAIAGFPNLAFGSNPGNTGKSQSFTSEKLQVNKDLNNINRQQAKIKSLEKQSSSEKKEGVRSASTNNELLKARADLKRERAYLLADKKDLMSAHRAVISERQKSVRTERAEMWNSRLKLEADLASGKPSAVKHAQEVVDARHDLKQGEDALKRARLNRNSDLLLVNKEIRDANGQSAFVLTTEDGAAKLQNLVMK